MSVAAGNILNELLLGKAAPQQPGGATSGVGAQLQVDGLTPFDQLLNLFGAISTPAEESPAINSEAPVLDLLGAARGVEQSDKSTTVSTLSAQAGLLAAMLPQISVNTKSMPISSETASASSTPVEPRQEEAVTTDNTMLVPRESVVNNPNVLAPLNRVPANLPSGTFAVLASKVSDGKLQLDIAPKDSSGQTIKLSIPVALLNQNNSSQSNPSENAAGIVTSGTIRSRVPVISPVSSTTRFEQLLSDVKVREIEISTEFAETKLSLPSSPTNINLVGESSGKPVLLSGRIARNQLQATTFTRPYEVTTTGQDNTANLDNGAQTGSKSTSKDAKGPVAEPAGDAMKSHSSAELAKLFEMNQGSANTAERTASPSLFGKDNMQPRAGAAAVPDRPSVRMTIQHELPRLTDLGGRTLMIKIEPEYLGPARLHLTMRQDALSARLTVDSPQAKAAVESSLNQLTDQLAKVGIRVDYIEVGVRGGGAQNQFFDRHSDWFRSQQPQIRANSEFEPILPEAPRPIVSLSRATYLAADRVNIYA